MKSKSLIYGLILLSLVLAGCEGGGNTTIGTPFIGGDSGISVSYRTNYPPLEVYDCGEDSFEVEVVLLNAGEYNVKTGEAVVTISGILPEDLGTSTAGLTKSNDQEILGMYKDENGNEVNGIDDSVLFEGLSYTQCLAGSTSLPLWANVCYYYETQAVSQICVLRNPKDVNGICSVQGEKDVEVSGAPVQIEEFKEYLRGSDKIGFSFKVVKKGSGKVHKDSSEDCAQSRVNDNRVFVEIDTGFGGVECRGLRDGGSTSGYVILDEGEFVVNCDQTTEATTDFQKPIDIKLKYKYSEDIPHTLSIKHIPSEE